MELESSVPPGFRFHPTEEELVGYYLTRKIASQKIDLQVITDIDLYRIEPWDLQERCKLRYEEQTEWYFFSHKDKKYPTGSRTNRATGAGFWKATGRDKAVLSKHKKIIGMRKTLVFYKGRAPNGRKTDWIMHEYRLQTTEHAPPQDEGWVVCRAFMKQSPNQRQSVDTWNPAYYSREHDHTAGIQAIAHVINPTQLLDPYQRFNFHEQSPSCSDQFVTKQTPFNGLIELPQLDSPTLPTSLVTKECPEPSVTSNEESSNYGGQFVDWRSLDQLLASQFSNVDVPLYSNSNLPLIPLDYDTSDAQNQENCFVATFPSS